MSRVLQFSFYWSFYATLTGRHHSGDYFTFYVRLSACSLSIVIGKARKFFSPPFCPVFSVLLLPLPPPVSILKNFFANASFSSSRWLCCARPERWMNLSLCALLPDLLKATRTNENRTQHRAKGKQNKSKAKKVAKSHTGERQKYVNFQFVRRCSFPFFRY